MKIQIEGQHLRFRIDEAELAELLDGRSVDNLSRLPSVQGARLVRHSVRLTSGHPACNCATDHWQLSVSRDALEEHARQLPSRDGLSFSFDAGAGHAELMTLRVTFDIDVRDSARKRFPKA
ncbi:hypothetical protein VB151_11605 [Xanthomonas fragariae]|uniref:Uncharacterized protein n=1 Tax=Xanthomonas fragariae TaxID=48664 RepID=A0A1Y6GW12_9XANT|nr:hypothetical protein [Xanthomonas fragariae]AOD15018.1 hypothetical protein BER92_10025 [Xanthomonas fragariae]AOD18417.1 hypothetical protein BER93_10045 [Xanthomonas fragariae]ENZ94044.1 hypothetical protein O1K_17623 [Xanthomonas fragariae LMG 25863]MBL9198649.1 hypothetical protein [Xanthomonas fragariae]MBL9220945.1 hypothetical protein [Xanthomonas fragariae]